MPAGGQRKTERERTLEGRANTAMPGPGTMLASVPGNTVTRGCAKPPSLWRFVTAERTRLTSMYPHRESLPMTVTTAPKVFWGGEGIPQAEVLDSVRTGVP